MADMLPGVRCLSDIETRPVRWLWHPYVPLEHVTAIYGDGDVRKSFRVDLADYRASLR